MYLVWSIFCTTTHIGNDLTSGENRAIIPQGMIHHVLIYSYREMNEIPRTPTIFRLIWKQN